MIGSLILFDWQGWAGFVRLIELNRCIIKLFSNLTPPLLISYSNILMGRNLFYSFVSDLSVEKFIFVL